MEEKKLTDEEIVQALECCVQEDDNCNECPYHKKKIKCYFGRHESDCLDLIRRLTTRTAKEILLWLIEHTHESDYIEKYFKERYGVEVE